MRQYGTEITLVEHFGIPSGGKSTVVSLLARLYKRDSGLISANGVPIEVSVSNTGVTVLCDVLDKTTSNLDTQIEQHVQSAIESMERDYTIIAIAHRLSTVRNADRIYTLQDGEIVESGVHNHLIGNEGKCALLYETQ